MLEIETGGIKLRVFNVLSSADFRIQNQYELVIVNTFELDQKKITSYQVIQSYRPFINPKIVDLNQRLGGRR